MATVWGAASRTAPERQRSFSSPAWAAVRRSTTRGRWRSAIAVFFRSDFNAKKKVRRSYQNLTAPSDAKVFIHTSSAAAAARRGAEGLRHRGLPHGPPAQALLRHDHARVGRDGAGGLIVAGLVLMVHAFQMIAGKPAPIFPAASLPSLSEAACLGHPVHRGCRYCRGYRCCQLRQCCQLPRCCRCHPVAPVLPVSPGAPVFPVLPVFPVFPVLPGAPCGPGGPADCKR